MNMMPDATTPATRQQPPSSGAPAKPSQQDNPWLLVMFVSALLQTIVGGVVLAAAADQSGSDSYLVSSSDPGISGLEITGVFCLGMAGTLWVAWMVCCALLWKPNN